MTTTPNCGAWMRLRRSPVSWLTLYGDGSFQIDQTVYGPASTLNCVVDNVKVTKTPGPSATLQLNGGHLRITMRHHCGFWYCWLLSTPAAIHAEQPRQPEPPSATAAATPGQTVRPVQENPDSDPEARTFLHGMRFPAGHAALILVLLMTAGFGIAKIAHFTQAAPLNNLVNVLRFDENIAFRLGRVHTLLTHSLIHDAASQFVYCMMGLLLFGWLVQRNIGCWRTLLLFAWSAIASVLLWRLMLTPLGNAVLHDLVCKLLTYLQEKFGLEIARMVATAYAESYDRLLDVHGPIAGSMGAVAGLAMFALCRRCTYSTSIPVRWLTLAAATVYLAVGWLVVWPVLLRSPTPYLLFLTGALAGWAFCYPDKALHHCSDSLKKALAKQQEESGA